MKMGNSRIIVIGFFEIILLRNIFNGYMFWHIQWSVFSSTKSCTSQDTKSANSIKFIRILDPE